MSRLRSDRCSGLPKKSTNRLKRMASIAMTMLLVWVGRAQSKQSVLYRSIDVHSTVGDVFGNLIDRLSGRLIGNSIGLDIATFGKSRAHCSIPRLSSIGRPARAMNTHGSTSPLRESRNDGTITLMPPLGRHSATIIFMHGLGDSAEGAVGFVREFSDRIPWAKVIVPSAPVRPVTISNGMSIPAWFDIKSLSLADANSMDGVDNSITFLDSMIEAEVAMGVGYDRVALVGFSMGGGLCLAGGLRRPADKKIAGVVAMSAFMPNPDRFVVSGSEDVPVLQTHGDKDMMVDVTVGQLTHDLIKGKGCTAAEFKIFCGLDHGANIEALQDVTAFLMRVLPDDASKRLASKDVARMSVKALKAQLKAYGVDCSTFVEKEQFVESLRKLMTE